MRSQISVVNAEYLVILFYLILLVVYGVVEAAWLRKREWSNWTKSLLFALLTNLIGFCIGFFLLFVTVGVTLALAWDGSMSNLPFQGNEFGVVFVVVVLLLPTLLALIKRLAILALRIGPGRRLWPFSFVSSIIFWIAPLAITIVLTKILWPRLMG